MNRRKFIAGGSLLLFGGLAGSAIANDSMTSNNQTTAVYQEDTKIVSEHDKLEFELRDQNLAIGDHLEVTITNTSDENADLGCNIPWALERSSGNEWEYVTWTSERYYQACATFLQPGNSSSLRISLTESWLEEEARELETELRPGKYRLVLVGASPAPTVSFDLTEG